MLRFDEVHTPCRRPCLLRARTNSDIDAGGGKLGSPMPRTGSLANLASGSSGYDDRALTLDSPSRAAGRATGLHRGHYNTQQTFAERPKGEMLRSLHALGILDTDGEMVRVRRRSTTGSLEPGRSRTKSESLRGLPTSGNGACIDLLGGRRCRGLQESVLGTAGGPNDAKHELSIISIDHQFSRRQGPTSPPRSPDCTSARMSRHDLDAVQYASLLGRPEGTGFSPRPSSRCSRRSLSPTSPLYGELRSTSPVRRGKATQENLSSRAGDVGVAPIAPAPKFKKEALSIQTEEDPRQTVSALITALTSLSDASRTKRIGKVCQNLLSEIDGKELEEVESVLKSSPNAAMLYKASESIGPTPASPKSPSFYMGRVGSPTAIKSRLLQPALGHRACMVSALTNSLSTASLVSDWMEPEQRCSPSNGEASAASMAASPSSLSLKSDVCHAGMTSPHLGTRSPKQKRGIHQAEEEKKAWRRAAWVS